VSPAPDQQTPEFGRAPGGHLPLGLVRDRHGPLRLGRHGHAAAVMAGRRRPRGASLGRRQHTFGPRAMPRGRAVRASRMRVHPVCP
jgi:hypothetical protein